MALLLMLAGCNDNKNSWRKHRHKLGRPCLFSTARRVKVCNRNNQNDVFFRIQKSVFRRFSFRRSPSPVAARIRRLSLLTYRRRAPAAGARVGARVLACDEVTRPLARLPSPVHCMCCLFPGSTLSRAPNRVSATDDLGAATGARSGVFLAPARSGSHATDQFVFLSKVGRAPAALNFAADTGWDTDQLRAPKWRRIVYGGCKKY